jgi:hypothetical protein
MLSDLILRQIADAITAQYAPDEVAQFLAEEGIPPAQLTLPDGTGEGDADVMLAALWQWGQRAAGRYGSSPAAGLMTGSCPARTPSCAPGSSSSSPGRAGGSGNQTLSWSSASRCGGYRSVMTPATQT